MSSTSSSPPPPQLSSMEMLLSIVQCMIGLLLALPEIISGVTGKSTQQYFSVRK
uniref:Uncharacterized protein n=1 Tax=Arion vulgaris TaxID=1028688 RepID=A0A0B6Z5T8_9EUPU